MIRVSIIYSQGDNARFDAEYYRASHMPMARRLLEPHGLVRVEIDRPLGGAMGAPAPFAAVGHLYFESIGAMQSAMAAHGGTLQADVSAFTDVEPQIQISEIVAC